MWKCIMYVCWYILLMSRSIKAFPKWKYTVCHIHEAQQYHHCGVQNLQHGNLIHSFTRVVITPTKPHQRCPWTAENNVTMISPVDLLLACLKLGKRDFWALTCVFGARVCTVKSKGNTDGSRVKLAAAVKKQTKKTVHFDNHKAAACIALSHCHHQEQD